MSALSSHGSLNAPITIPVPPGTDRVLLVGGSFDPPHCAHAELPHAARQALWGGDGWLMYVPAAQSPHKADAPQASAADRTAMLRLALRGVERAAVWTDELERGGVSYTVQTLRRARMALGTNCAMRLLIGADQAAVFHRWREPREVIALAEPAVMLREPFGSAAALVGAMRVDGFWTDAELEAWRRRVLSLPMVPASATDARDLLRRGGATTALEGTLPALVIDYIRERGLYG